MVYAKEHGLRKGDFFVLFGTIDRLANSRELRNGVMFHCDSVLSQDHFQAGHATDTIRLVFQTEAYSGGLTTISHEIIKQKLPGETLDDVASHPGFSVRDILAVACKSVNGSVVVKVPFQRVESDSSLASMKGESFYAEDVILGKCVFTKVKGAFGFQDNYPLEIGDSDTYNKFSTTDLADGGIKDGDVVRMIGLEDITSSTNDGPFKVGDGQGYPLLDLLFAVTTVATSRSTLDCSHDIAEYLKNRLSDSNSVFLLKINDPSFTPIQPVRFARDSMKNIHNTNNAPHGLKTGDAVYISNVKSSNIAVHYDSCYGANGHMQDPLEWNDTACHRCKYHSLLFKQYSQWDGKGLSIQADTGVARINGIDATLPFITSKNRFQVYKKRRRYADVPVTEEAAIRHDIRDGDAVLISGITKFSHMAYNGNIVTVVDYSIENETFALDGVDTPFADDMIMLLTKVSNRTRRMRTGVTRSNPAVVSLDLHGFQNGDVIRISDINGMDEIQNQRVIISERETNRFSLRWSIPSRKIYARTSDRADTLVSQKSNALGVLVSHNLQPYDALAFGDETYCVNSTNGSAEFRIQDCNDHVPFENTCVSCMYI